MSKPQIVTFQMNLEDFLFLGIENKIVDSIQNTDFGKIWGGFFEMGGFDKIDPYKKKPYDCMVVYHNKNPECPLTYFIGSIVEDADNVPEGYTLMQFPAREYLVVTHEWVPTKDEAIGQIFNVNGYQQNVPMPDGYIRHDGIGSEIMLVERENMDTENGSRYEFWVPIKKVEE